MCVMPKSMTNDGRNAPFAVELVIDQILPPDDRPVHVFIPSRN